MPGNFLAWVVSLRQLVPGILFRLLEPERDPLLLGIDRQDHHFDFLALAHHLGGMLHPPGPAHVGDVHESVYPRLDFHEGAEGGEIADNALDTSSRRILVREREPGILLGLLHSEGDLLVLLIDAEHHAFDLLPDRDELRGVSHVSGPTHLGDVDEPLHPLLELYERAVVGDRHDLAPNPGPDGVPLGDILPRIRLQLLESQRNALTIPVDIEDLDLEILADITHFRGVPDASPGHVGDVKQAVHAAEINERAEVGDVLHHAGANLANLELVLELIPLPGSLLLEDDTPADDDVAATFVELEDLEVVLLTDQILDVVDAPESDLRPGQESVNTH